MIPGYYSQNIPVVMPDSLLCCQISVQPDGRIGVQLLSVLVTTELCPLSSFLLTSCLL